MACMVLISFMYTAHCLSLHYTTNTELPVVLHAALERCLFHQAVDKLLIKRSSSSSPQFDVLT